MRRGVEGARPDRYYRALLTVNPDTVSAPALSVGLAVLDAAIRMPLRCLLARRRAWLRAFAT
jgi:hypothetical protein